MPSEAQAPKAKPATKRKVVRTFVMAFPSLKPRASLTMRQGFEAAGRGEFLAVFGPIRADGGGGAETERLEREAGGMLYHPGERYPSRPRSQDVAQSDRNSPLPA